MTRKTQICKSSQMNWIDSIIRSVYQNCGEFTFFRENFGSQNVFIDTSNAVLTSLLKMFRKKSYKLSLHDRRWSNFFKKNAFHQKVPPDNKNSEFSTPLDRFWQKTICSISQIDEKKFTSERKVFQGNAFTDT